MQLASFFFEAARGAPRSAKAPFAAVAPWRPVAGARRGARQAAALDTIQEEEYCSDPFETSTAVSTGASQCLAVLSSRLRALAAPCLHSFPSSSSSSSGVVFLVVLAWLLRIYM